ncbi:hypothetical protein A2810_00045 [candidate division Kazan bacterium RIFCSPHIGHO2_01_FULL_49_10]|uniref:Uncharacterized protein n=1 Tax=candidate division Kazan bacterium RIFCSPLOWO2_01_FULL_48_13 TaxID=1798539 RepID=A0A1F4PNL0_UNCK3|nr:MAG: hypothetical protein A2810_00045 [candidate division Kazan bacterium RIFCSPHIGHO2_01_FULL_49_10]OGB85238.1 MAG: hypothetical protein A2994_00135 [candidate division Kazan bacterium RIFCSPLOWO2_01_FULL_48_13]
MEKSKTQIDLSSRPLFVGTAVALVVLLGLTIWGFISNRSLADTTLQAGDLQIDKTEVAADGIDSSQVTVTITQKGNNAPAADVWVGLNIKTEELITQDLSNFGWYSPESGRSFYQTDALGKVEFSVRSRVAGDITYTVYAADPEQKNSGKYLSLERDFTIHFK